MRLEYPAFLYALLVIAIPVIVHLFNFRRYKKLYFSNVQFLKQVYEQQATGRNLKERLLLLCRLMALLFLVLAFAKPYFTGKDVTGAQKQAVSIFVDNSNSMQALGSQGSLLDEAKSKAKEIAASFGPNTQFQLLTQDFYGKNQRFIDKAEFANEVDGVTLSSQTRGLQTIINRQQSLLATLNNTDNKIYIISDFQKNVIDKKINNNLIKSLSLVQLKTNNLPNAAIDSVWLPGAVHRPGEIEKLVFKLHNYADEKAASIPLKLFINKQQKALGSYTVPPNSFIIDTLSFSGLQAGWQTAELRLQDNPVTFDNVFHFDFYVAAQMPVLLINADKVNLFLKAVFDAEPFFKITAKSYGSINYSTLQYYPLIILSDVKSVSSGLAQQLKEYVSKGGSLAVFPSADMDIGSYQTFLQGLNAAYYGKLVNDTTKVSAINLNARVYKNTFENMPQNPDLPKINSYYPLNENPGLPSEKLMSLSNNQDFWGRFNYGLGKIYVCAVPVNESYSNLPRHSLFVTTLLRIGLLSGHEQQLYTTIGNNQPVVVNNISTSADEVFKLTNGKEHIIPDVRMRDGGASLYLADQITKPGTYQLLKKDSVVELLSFNNNTNESDMHYAKPADLEKLGDNNTQVIVPGSVALKNNTNKPDFGFQLWKLCLLLALISLGAEILITRFFKTTPALTS